MSSSVSITRPGLGAPKSRSWSGVRSGYLFFFGTLPPPDRRRVSRAPRRGARAPRLTRATAFRPGVRPTSGPPSCPAASTRGPASARAQRRLSAARLGGRLGFGAPVLNDAAPRPSGYDRHAATVNRAPCCNVYAAHRACTAVAGSGCLPRVWAAHHSACWPCTPPIAAGSRCRASGRPTCLQRACPDCRCVRRARGPGRGAAPPPPRGGGAPAPR